MKPMKSYDAIVVLGFRLLDDGSAADELKGRVALAAQCYRAGLAPFVVVCGGQTEGMPCTEASVMEALLMDACVPEDCIIKENQSMTTYENLRNAHEILMHRLKQQRKLRIVLVSSDYHLLRARYIAHSLKFKTKCRAFMTPDDQEKKARHREELYYFINYAFGWETGKRKMPGWVKKIADKIA